LLHCRRDQDESEIAVRATTLCTAVGSGDRDSAEQAAAVEELGAAAHSAPICASLACSINRISAAASANRQTKSGNRRPGCRFEFKDIMNAMGLLPETPFPGHGFSSSCLEVAGRVLRTGPAVRMSRPAMK